MRFRRLHEHKLINDVLEDIQPDLQQVQLVEEAKAIVNHIPSFRSIVSYRECDRVDVI